MAAWEGFTDAELQKIQSSGNHSNKLKSKAQPKIAKPVGKKKNAITSSVPCSTILNIENQQKIASINAKQIEKIPEEMILKNTESVLASAKNFCGGDVTTINNTSNKDQELVAVEKSDCIFDDVIIKEKEKIKLEDVQQRQRQMEERNRRKKEMLTKEIAARKKKAFAESSKLLKIQQELTKLDELINVDVSVLRDRIDEACFEFSLAQKRFTKAEAEYVSAKMHLNDKTVLKEDLTEHLFNLIQANEERKAKKLEELMLKLNVEEAEINEKEQKQSQNTNFLNSISIEQTKTLSKNDAEKSTIVSNCPSNVATVTAPNVNAIAGNSQSNNDGLHGETQ